MSIPVFLVDAFADAPFAGNPSDVCLLEVSADAAWMQAVAAALKQPATACSPPTAHQASVRGGTVQVCLDGSRVRRGGRAVTVMQGSLLSAPTQRH